MHSGYGDGLSGMSVWWWAVRILLVAGIVWLLAKQVAGRR